MKVKKRLQCSEKRNKNVKNMGDSVRSFVLLTACAFLAVVVAIGSKFLDTGERNQVYAASEADEGVFTSPNDEEWEDGYIPTGIAGVVSGVKETRHAGGTVKRIGTSCERVVVGQRVKKVKEAAAEMNVSSSMENTVNNLDAQTITLAETPKLMSDTDYDTLLRIVEAEAGGEDIKGRVLVANVIMNRVNSENFPDTVTEVVWQYSNGVPQFSPTYDGRISEVTVSDDTKEAVKQALEGVDYSQGALFFIQRSEAEAHNVSWFDKDLKKLFKYGVHDFYTYPDETDSEQNTSEKDTSDNNVVQMVKK